MTTTLQDKFNERRRPLPISGSRPPSKNVDTWTSKQIFPDISKFISSLELTLLELSHLLFSSPRAIGATLSCDWHHGKI